MARILGLLLLLGAAGAFYVSNTPQPRASQLWAKKNDKKKPSKEDIVKAVGDRMRQQKKTPASSDGNLLDKLNPFLAGQKLRQTIDTALTSRQDSVYYLDDRLGISPKVEDLLEEDFVPEVLVVGATGEVGRLVVKRLLREGRCRVRVLVRDLYTKTLNMLGAGVTYCQGDLLNMDSLEYALTDVDKIIFCASPPRPDEEQFQEKFRDYMKELAVEESLPKSSETSDQEWEQLESVLELRSRMAEQVDCIGMQNLVRAYQHVRHADYGASQAAKRTLFKFGRADDFNLFSIDEDAVDDVDGVEEEDEDTVPMDLYDYDDMEDEDEEYDDYEDFVEERNDATVKTQVQWMRNKFDHAVFVGRIAKKTDAGIGGEATVVSTRFRSRDDPDNGIDLGSGFAGFIARVCSDGGTYEAFIRTKSFADDGIEYACEFSTSTKPTGRNKSSNKFTTVRLPFENFKPVRSLSSNDKTPVPAFDGKDVRRIGFRYRCSSNQQKMDVEAGELTSFYLALSYIKLYRAQPEPEFVYLSDSNIPPVVRANMISHDAKQLVTSGDGVRLLDQSVLQTATQLGRSPAETYYKFRGEDILKKSGLSYAIVRVAGFSESPTGEASTLELTSTGGQDDSLVSRDEAALVCVSALLDPDALNKSFYMRKRDAPNRAGDDEVTFASLPLDQVV